MFCFAVVSLLLGGCTSVAEIRTHHGPGAARVQFDANDPAQGCASASSTSPERANSIEDYQAYWAGFVEFDDEGWLYDPHGQPSQMDVLQSKLKAELRDPAYADTDFLVIAFVHGWHHNANDTDCNVHEFRSMLKIANDRYAQAVAAATAAGTQPPMHPRRIVGVYAGWRGESIDVEGLNVTTALDRRNAAERVAKGDVRELFALLRKLQVGESQKTDPAGGPMRSDRMRTVVVGHSFGGLIAFHGLSPAVLNELTLTKPGTGDTDCAATVNRPTSVMPYQAAKPPAKPEQPADGNRSPPVFPDMLVLINPAFEATRFESLHALMRPNGCTYPVDRPKVVVVTADNDWATGPLFHAARKVLTLLEAYPREWDSPNGSRERDSNTHAIAFTSRYPTHRLCLVGDGAARHAVASLTPPSAPDWTPLDANAPVWVVRAPPDIVDNHNGFLFVKPPGVDTPQPYLLDWLVKLHLAGPGAASPAMTTDNSCPEGGASAGTSAGAQAHDPIGTNPRLPPG